MTTLERLNGFITGSTLRTGGAFIMGGERLGAGCDAGGRSDTFPCEGFNRFENYRDELPQLEEESEFERARRG